MAASQQHALILFAHGARDARWSETLQVLRNAVLARRPHSRVEVAFLEFQKPTLAEALGAAAAHGCTVIDVAPVFWASGGHVLHDVPPMIDAFRVAHPGVEVAVLPVLSELPGMMQFVASAVDALCATRTSPNG